MTGKAELTGIAAAAITAAVAAEVAGELDPLEFAAVTATEMVCPISPVTGI